MRPHLSTPPAPQPVPPGWAGATARTTPARNLVARPAVWTASLLDLVDPAPDSRVVLIGPGALDLGCTLMQAGTAEVALIRLGECPRNVQADIAIVPRPPCLDAAARAVTLAARMLCPLGTLALGSLAADWVAPLAAHLRALGFDATHLFATGDGMLLRAELPLHGRLPCAPLSCAPLPCA